MARMILVSNRLPITVNQADDGVRVTRSTGGLVAGLGPIHDEDEGLWFGSMSEAMEIDDELKRQRLRAVKLTDELVHGHYEGYSNQVIWPLFHYLLDAVAFDSAAFEAYERVNELFADAIAAEARPRDQIWVHDYHLMLLPSMLRERLPRARIGFFLHIPFPSSEVFRILPGKEAILRGLLGADVIGLHTYDYARHLVSCFRRILGEEFDEEWVRARNHATKVGVFPLGVDYETLDRQARKASVRKRADKLRHQLLDRKVILGVDRLDYTKGIPLRLEAFRRLLERYPRWRRNAVFVQLSVPSRGSIESYQNLKHEVDRMVGEINGAFGTEGLAPVDYMYRSVSADELAALYTLADVACVTPIRDGMNLVAKEYVAHRVREDGVLMLSEFAGAAAEMGEALLHNPWDIDGSADTLHRALSMKKAEQRHRMQALRERTRRNDVHLWARRFVRSLQAQALRVEAWRSASRGPTARGWGGDLTRAFRSAEHVLLALDYDGTLTSFQKLPEKARPRAPLRKLLRALADLQGVELLLISGRDRNTLDRWFKDTSVHIVAEHGLYYRPRGGDGFEQLLPDIDVSWADGVRDILAEYSSRCPGSFIEEKAVTLAWHYRQVEPGFGIWQANELVQHLAETFANVPLQVLHGNKVVEVRPQGLDKGRAYQLVSQKLGPFDLEICAGDDRTDEDMFAVMADPTWSIKVGPGGTHARRRLNEPAELTRLLGRLLRSRRPSK